ncbi:DUF2934 domain-containing protein [Methylomicrobium sp. Wu6]|uniref:DUF2934 domain-containing protein n=1 Tax=Methylomicrobium sp. Wu6 TaxID=3107928 RepID=UPI002DD65999|nr:DUF2934 domain-containing protein [Methylomicrobium sp. Wu6]MEC4747032.1 DUF2934 domain-containing protein [Methylomicrobium sp. Wu6]
MKPTTPNVHQNTENLTSDESGIVLDPSDKTARISELAYYKAEKRGFEPGRDLEDWLEAEQELASKEE